MENLENVFWQILPVLISLAVPTAMVLATWLAKKLSSKLDVEFQSAMNDFIMGLVTQGVAHAEQLAKQKEKENEEVHGEDKLYLAINYVLQEMEKYNLVSVTAEEIAAKVESVLGQSLLNEPAFLKNLEKGENNEEATDF